VYYFLWLLIAVSYNGREWIWSIVTGIHYFNLLSTWPWLTCNVHCREECSPRGRGAAACRNNVSAWGGSRINLARLPAPLADISRSAQQVQESLPRWLWCHWTECCRLVFRQGQGYLFLPPCADWPCRQPAWKHGNLSTCWVHLQGHEIPLCSKNVQTGSGGPSSVVFSWYWGFFLG
jgi:hypothetical protein